MENNKGISLITLVITIIVLIILTSIALSYGTESIQKAELENLKTNMLLIKAKSKEYCEAANFKLGTGTVPDASSEEYNTYIEPAKKYLKNIASSEGGETPASGKEDENRPSFNEDTVEYSTGENATKYNGITENQFITKLTSQNLKDMGLDSVTTAQNEEYIVGFNITGNKVEIYSTKGYNNKYSLSELEGN